jgi:alpha-tubulin suppressor-like RCC1 family protein
MEPGPVEGLDGVKIVKLACGDSISLALSDDGKVYSWGSFRVRTWDAFLCKPIVTVY